LNLHFREDLTLRMTLAVHAAM